MRQRPSSGFILSILAAAQLNYSCAQSGKKTVQQPEAAKPATASVQGDGYKQIAQEVKGAFKAYLSEASVTEENKGLVDAAKEIDAQSADQLAATFSSEDFEDIQDAVLLEQMIAEEATGNENLTKNLAITSLTGGAVILVATLGAGVKWYRTKPPIFDEDAYIEELYTKLIVNEQKIKAIQNLSPEVNPLKDAAGGKKVFMPLDEFKEKIKLSEIGEALKIIMISSYGDLIRDSAIRPGDKKIEDFLPDQVGLNTKVALVTKVDVSGKRVFKTDEELLNSHLLVLKNYFGETNANAAFGKAINLDTMDLSKFDRKIVKKYIFHNTEDNSYRYKTAAELLSDQKRAYQKIGINILAGEEPKTVNLTMAKKSLTIIQNRFNEKIAANKLAASKTSRNRRIAGAIGVIFGAGFAITGGVALMNAKDKNKKDTSASTGSVSSASEDTQGLQLTGNASPEEKLMKALQQAESKIAIARFK